MRQRYSYLDPDLIRQLLAEMGLRRLFNHLLLQTGGDVEEAMRWMKALQAGASLLTGAPGAVLLYAVLALAGGIPAGQLAVTGVDRSGPPDLLRGRRADYLPRDTHDHRPRRHP